MKRHLAKIFWFAVLVLVMAGLGEIFFPLQPDAAAQRAVAETRQSLRQQGFKTDLADFDFTTTPEQQAREAILHNAIGPPGPQPITFYPNLQQPIRSNSAIVVWKLDSLEPVFHVPDYADNELSWDGFRAVINKNQKEIDAVCAAVMAGSIRWNLDARQGMGLRLPHLALMKTLTQTMCSRAVIDLHDGDLNSAWTNLMAATRLVTAWETDPIEFSHLVRFADTELTFGALWQALQTNGWPEEKLLRLQQEWESVNFFTNLPEIVAFNRASLVAQCQQQRQEWHSGPVPIGEFVNDVLHYPLGVWQALKYQASQREYFRRGTYVDEKNLMLFYRDREVEMRNAVQAPTWATMRQLPGVTNASFFQFQKHSRMQVLANLRRMNLAFHGQGTSFLGCAAEAEAERRLIITAIALERYHGKYGSYPQSLAALTPQFLKNPLPDFMDGQPLRYRRVEDGHFLLYSVGQDCVDDGGKFPTRPKDAKIWQVYLPRVRLVGTDILWPLPASSAQVVALRKQQSRAAAERWAQIETELKAQAQRDEQHAEESKQAAMKKLLAKNPSLGEEPVYQGKPLSAWVTKVGQIEEYNGAPQDAVAAIRATGPKAIPFLLAWMPHPGAEEPVEGFLDWSDIEVAWWALGNEGKSAIPTLARLISLPRHTMDDYSMWAESAKAISYLGPDAIVPMLTVATNMEGQHELWELLHNFENLGTNGAAAVPALIHWAHDPDYWVRDAVVCALGGIGERPDLAVPVLTNALEHDSNWMVRRDAAEALGSFANDSGAVLPLLIKTLKDPDWHARGGALSGLGKIRNKPQVVVPLVAPFLYDPNSVIQRTAAYALRDLGSEAGYRALLQASNAPSSWPGIGDIIYEARQKINRDKPR